MTLCIIVDGETAKSVDNLHRARHRTPISVSILRCVRDRPDCATHRRVGISVGTMATGKVGALRLLPAMFAVGANGVHTPQTHVANCVRCHLAGALSRCRRRSRM